MTTTHATDQTATEPRFSRIKLWGLALLPIVLLGVLLAVIVGGGATESIRGEAPPVEVLAIERLELSPAGFRVWVLNDGPDPVTIAQVMVDEAYWSFTQEPPGELSHLRRAVLQIPYPWVEGETHELVLVSRNGITFPHEIAVAIETPRPSLRFFGLFALIGLYVGVLPVGLGLLWYPLVRRLRSGGLDFVLALTVGLLLFLLIDTVHEGLEAAKMVASSLQGLGLFLFAGLLAYLAIEGLGGWLARRGGTATAGWVTALLVAVGIGLHNFGEGLAIGAAFALGEVALGTLLIVGFTLHNTTEGLAIVAPLGHETVSLPRLGWLGLIAGAPTIAGAWIGGFVYSPFWSVLFLAIGAGAIAQVIVQIARSRLVGKERRTLTGVLQTRAVVGGLVAGFGLMYVTGMIVG